MENNLKFLNYTIAEDFLFFTSVLLLNPAIISTSYNIYRYIVHETALPLQDLPSKLKNVCMTICLL